MQSLSKYKKGIKYLLSVIDLFSKHAWVVLLKDKQGITKGRKKDANQIKYGLIKAANFTIVFLRDF